MGILIAFSILIFIMAYLLFKKATSKESIDDLFIERHILCEYVVNCIPCKICNKPLVNGDLLIGIQKLIDEPGITNLDDLTVFSFDKLFVHARCYVFIIDEDDLSKDKKLRLTRLEYDNWISSIKKVK